ncbi:hypothetical protein TCAL_04204 [Tigriopus californicus]|uniref:Uncharacterized protein n=1 Tax=Tigriopus californicus TaxID=6832 RepID=A0A553N710_TIGCA|nr:hypothetical protein TCAL_04204 [Tigriopus californicus]
MRTAVSSILSEMKDPSPLCFPDYEQTYLDHARIWILVQGASEAQLAHLRTHHARWSQPTPPGPPSQWAAFRYLTHYPLENNEWRDFQTFRGVMGLLSFVTWPEATMAVKRHRQTQAQLASSLRAHRLIAPPNCSHELQGPVLLVAPFERKDFVGLDLDSRINKKRTLGRFKKHLGDLALQSGRANEAFTFYEAALEHLKSCNDWMWLGNTVECLCALSVLAGTSFGPIFEVEPFIQEQLYRGDEFVEKCRELVVNYSKYRYSGMIETEACVKAVRVMIAQRQTLHAAEFLQNVVFINLNMTDTEKVKRFAALSELYGEIGFSRKSAFFHRVAAMRCVAPHNPQPEWELCYQLLLKTMPGYFFPMAHQGTVSTNSNHRVDSSKGWATVQVQILQELVGTARRMGDHLIAIKHLVFLLENFHHCLPTADLDTTCQEIFTLATRMKQQHLPLPKYTLHSIPKLIKFQPVSAVPESGSWGGSAESQPTGPFLFTPILNYEKRRKRCEWIKGEACEVEIDLITPPIPISVVDMRLLSEGNALDPCEVSFVMNPSDPKPIVHVKLTAIPQSFGDITLTGVSFVLFGLEVECLLKDLGLDSEENCPIVHVNPSLPRLHTHLEVLKAPVNPKSLEIYNGETLDMDLSIVGAQEEIPLILSCTMTPHVFNSCVSIMDQRLNEICIKSHPDVKTRISLRGPTTSCLSEETDEYLTSSSSSSSSTKALTLTLTLKSAPPSADSDRVPPKVCINTPMQKISLHVLPSISVCWWDVFPSENPRECYLVIDILNSTSDEAEITYLDGKKIIVIDSQAKCRVPIALEKIASPDESEASFARHIDDQVNIVWSLKKLERNGLVSLKEIQLTPNMIQTLSLCDIDWSLFVNGQQWLGMELQAQAGQPIEVTIRLSRPTLAAASTEDKHEKWRCMFSLNCHYEEEVTPSGQIKRIELPSSGSKCVRSAGNHQNVTYKAVIIAPNCGNLFLKSSCEAMIPSDQATRIVELPLVGITIQN